MRDLFIDPEKIGEVVYKGEYEDKKEESFFQFNYGQDWGRYQDWKKEKLKVHDKRDVFKVKSKKYCRIEQCRKNE